MKKLLVILVVVGFAMGCATTSKFTEEQIKNGTVEIVSTYDESSMFRGNNRRSQLQSAFEHVKEAIKKDPGNAVNYADAAQIFLMMGDYDKAEDFAKRAIRMDLDRADVPRKVLAQAYLRKNNKDLALIIVNSLGGVNSKDGEVHNILGLVALKNNEMTTAMNHFKDAIKFQSNILSARLNLGLLYLKNHQLNSAKKQFTEVMGLYPDHPDARLNLAIIDSQTGKHTEALAVFNETLKSDSSNPIALYNLAVLHNNTKNYEKALEYVKSYLKTKRASTHSTEPAFALMEDIKSSIQKKQEAIAKEGAKKSPQAKKDAPVQPIDSNLGH